jgi:hypothetical protein
MIVNTHEQVAQLRLTIVKNAGRSFSELKEYAQNTDALQFFASIKFIPLGKDPITGDALNLIEQINQTYSNLVVLAAAHDLIDRYPDKSFVLQLGASSGSDVRSTDGEVAAECFAVTSVSSNDKMNKDCKKLMESGAQHKYIFFYTYQDSDQKLQRRYEKYPDIHFERVY